MRHHKSILQEKTYGIVPTHGQDRTPPIAQMISPGGIITPQSTSLEFRLTDIIWYV